MLPDNEHGFEAGYGKPPRHTRFKKGSKVSLSTIPNGGFRQRPATPSTARRIAMRFSAACSGFSAIQTRLCNAAGGPSQLLRRFLTPSAWPSLSVGEPRCINCVAKYRKHASWRKRLWRSRRSRSSLSLLPTRWRSEVGRSSSKVGTTRASPNCVKASRLIAPPEPISKARIGSPYWPRPAARPARSRRGWARSPLRSTSSPGPASPIMRRSCRVQLGRMKCCSDLANGHQ